MLRSSMLIGFPFIYKRMEKDSIGNDTENIPEIILIGGKESINSKLDMKKIQTIQW